MPIISSGFVGQIHPHLTKVKTVVKKRRKPAKAAPHVPVYLPELWALLHRRALASNGEEDLKFLEDFRKLLPCGTCRQDWDRMLLRTPPDFSAYFAWTVDRHNEVNRMLNKAEMTLEAAKLRWKAGGVRLGGSVGNVRPAPAK